MAPKPHHAAWEGSTCCGGGWICRILVHRGFIVGAMLADIREKELSVDQQSERDPQQDFVPPPDRDRKSRWGFRGMTVREWLPIGGALLIPVVIAAGTWVITWQQAKIEDQRAQAERELEEQRAQDDALQAYLDKMSNLLLEKDLRTSEVNSEVRTLARARTLTVLERLDPSRKDNVIQFLSETSLINVDPTDQKATAVVDGEVVGKDIDSTNLQHDWNAILPEEVEGPVIPLGTGTDPFDIRGPAGVDLHGTDLMEADLSNADLRDANLSDAKLKYASLVAADLGDADLSSADPIGADLRYADLYYANLQGADLSGADLAHADLGSAHLSNANLNSTSLGQADLAFADLSNAWLPGTDLRHAHLLEADLSNADLSNADLREANLREANLREAALNNAHLKDANLEDARVSEEQLAQAYSLEGATMPNGQPYEDGLKDREGR
jgi:uncharacterized protein YjbI with pentapeptide repeats